MKKAANSNDICQICSKNPANVTYHPFCSARCADVDLGRWMSGTYVIPGEKADVPKDIQEIDPDETE